MSVVDCDMDDRSRGLTINGLCIKLCSMVLYTANGVVLGYLLNQSTK